MLQLSKKYKPYKSYKDSGMEWLGTIPEVWEKKRLKFVLQLITKKASEDDFKIGLENIEGWTGKLIENDAIFEGEGIAFKKNDFLFGKLRPYLAKVLLTELPGSAVGDFFVMRLIKDAEPKYWFYFLISRPFIDSATGSTFGAKMPRVSWEFLANQIVSIPPLPEQRAIARFLDEKTAQLDALIEKKERLLELLAEKRTALITQAVTKGLNPKAKMKDSGIEWLGEVPEGWEVTLMKYKAEISYGIGGEIDRTLTEGTNLISLPNLTKDGNLLLEEVPLCELTESEKKKYLLRKGDLLFNWRNGSSDHLGKTAYFDLDEKYTHVSFILRLRFNSRLNNSRFFQYVLNGLRLTGFFSSSKAGVNNTFNLNELANLHVMVPPKEEQDAIADFINNRLTKVDKVSDKLHSAISQLKEYRTALITAAVTGKIDVREQA